MSRSQRSFPDTACTSGHWNRGSRLTHLRGIRQRQHRKSHRRHHRGLGAGMDAQRWFRRHEGTPPRKPQYGVSHRLDHEAIHRRHVDAVGRRRTNSVVRSRRAISPGGHADCLQTAERFAVHISATGDDDRRIGARACRGWTILDWARVSVGNEVARCTPAHELHIISGYRVFVLEHRLRDSRGRSRSRRPRAIHRVAALTGF